MAYRLALPPMLARVHNVFHVSMLRKYIPDRNHVMAYEPLQLREDLTYEEQPVRIVDKKEQELSRHTIQYVKVQWSNHIKREATWELEEEMREKYPYLFEESIMSSFGANLNRHALRPSKQYWITCPRKLKSEF